MQPPGQKAPVHTPVLPTLPLGRAPAPPVSPMELQLFPTLLQLCPVVLQLCPTALQLCPVVLQLCPHFSSCAPQKPALLPSPGWQDRAAGQGRAMLEKTCSPSMLPKLRAMGWGWPCPARRPRSHSHPSSSSSSS